METDNKFLRILNKFLGIIRNNVNLSSTFFRIIFSEIFSTFDIIQILRYKFGKARSFIFNGKELNYFYHTYHNQRITERAIEIPLVRYYLENMRPENCLEIGNVTNHYYTYFQNIFKSKIVVDKYEKGWGVINKDITDYTVDEKFEFIFSISTFEHMDSGEGSNQEYVKGKPKLCSYAADNIVHVCNNLLKPGGLFLITAPISQHTEWDFTLFKSGILNERFLEVKSIKIYYMKKTSEIEWKQTNIREAKKAKKNYPFIWVNCISIIEIIK